MTGASEIRNKAQSISGVQAGYVDTVIQHIAPHNRAIPRQLPLPSADFIGRETELHQLTVAHDTSPTVVISALGGVGGIGKTWLALHWAYRNLDRFPDGQLFVDLRGFDQHEKPMPPHEAVRGFLDALGVPPDDMPQDPAAQIGLYRTLTADKRILIVLDNARDSEQVEPLLPGASGTVLITSRDRMDALVTGYHARPVAVTALDDAAARDLLTQRLGAQRLADEPDAVDELIRWCAGLPLALSIVAGQAQINVDIPLATLAEELRDASSRLSALDGGGKTALQAVLSWSYHALTPQDARVFRLLGTAPGADISRFEAANLTGLSKQLLSTSLQALARVSLVQGHFTTSVRLHDLVRLYAASLATPEETTDALLRLAAASSHTSHAADRLIAAHHQEITLGELPPDCTLPDLKQENQAWHWLVTERANVMALQQEAFKRGWFATVWALAWTMTTFNLRQGHLHDNFTAWVSGVEAAKHLDKDLRTRAYRHLSRACSDLSRYEDAYHYGLEGLAWARECGDELGEAHTRRAVARACERRGDDEEALKHSIRALELYDRLGQALSGSHALDEIGWYTAKLGRFEEARTRSTAALAQCRERMDASGEAKALMTLGFIANGIGDPVAAIRQYEESQAISQRLGDAKSEARVLDHLGDAAVAIDPAKAVQAWERAAELYRAQRLASEADAVREKLADRSGK
ncbi:ATP-binding protein [Kutzneria chonburiensis]|uniref:NB-ARC domain-containing protein n=1 Tax=Kutzneria chonburiensis TaxID=1483604 RepID=A0ABV6MUC4_9PSEU|nr:NB-ARC domain-containing protein [Kutzneria chonburiensis]